MNEDEVPVLILDLKNPRLEDLLNTDRGHQHPVLEVVVVMSMKGYFFVEAMTGRESPSEIEQLLLAASIAFEEGKVRRGFGSAFEPTAEEMIIGMEDFARTLSVLEPSHPTVMPPIDPISAKPRRQAARELSRVKNWHKRLPPRPPIRRGT